MQLLVIALPFLLTLTLLILERVLPSLKFKWNSLVPVVLPVIGLGLSSLLVWQPLAKSEDGIFGYSPLSQIFLTLLFILCAIAVAVVYLTDNLNLFIFGPVTLSVCGTINVAFYINNVFIVVLCFVGAEFISIISIVDVGTGDEERFVRTVKSAVRYLIVTVLFGLLLFVAQVFLERLRLDPQQVGLIKIIVALAITGFALRLGVFPLNLWVPQVVEDSPALASWLALGMVNAAAVIFLVDFSRQNPVLLINNYSEAQAVMILGLAGAVLAGALALVQTSFGKMLAYTISGNLSLILFGLASPHETGLRGALFDTANFALTLLLIFTSLAAVFYCNHGRPIARLTGLGRRMPVSAVGLIFGLLSMAGIPVFSGFAGKYLILQSAAQEGLVWVLFGGLAIMLWLLAYLRYFHNLFMGREVPGLKTRPEPLGAIVVILGLISIVILAGIWPTPILDWLGNSLGGS